jgi:hypothetical protein
MTFRVIGRTKAPNWSDIPRNVKRAMKGPVKRRLPEYPKDVTSGWDHNPEFSTNYVQKPNRVSVQSEPKGPNRQIWVWMVEGTGLHGPKHKAYPIYPKRAKVLAFPSTYTPHTTPSGGVKGPGKSSGPTIFTAKVDKKGVTHPGMEKRPLVTMWVKSVVGWFVPMMQEIITKSARSA